MKLQRRIMQVLLTAFLFSVLAVNSGTGYARQLPTGVQDGRNAEADWDAFFDDEMRDFGVYGALMVIVKDGGISFMKGYGYTDASKEAYMDPQSTVVRAGSVVKTVTAMAVMQLAERGAIDLDEDVNTYLTSWQVPDTFEDPVTARQLLNMSGGFDTRWIGIRASSRETVRDLGEYIGERMPPRVMPPGRYRRYNDHEYALAGLLVEDVSGLSYEEYVRKNIFTPLEMDSSSVLLPLGQEKDVARGYPVDGNAEDVYPLNYYYLNDAPGSGFNTTAADIANYMLAHLGNGEFERGDGEIVQVVNAASASELHSTGFRHDERLPGIVYGFDEIFYNGQRMLRKNGGAPGMNNSIILVPEQNLGFYLFYNSEGYAMRNHWADAVLDAYIPEASDIAGFEPVTADSYSGDPEAYTGLYMQISDYTSETTLLQVQALVSDDVWARVRANPDGSLQIWNGNYVLVENNVARDSQDGDYVIFEKEDGSKASYLFASRTAFRRTAWYAAPPFQLGILGVSVFVFLISILALIFGLVRKSGTSTLLSGLVSVVNLIFLISLMITMLPVATGGDVWQFSFDAGLGLRLVLALPLISTMLSAGLLVDNLHAWFNGRYTLTARTLGTLVLAAMLGFLFFLDTWNLLGWRF